MSPFPPRFITPALVAVMGRVCPTRPLGGDLACILQDVPPDSLEDVHTVVEAYLRDHDDESPEPDTDWEEDPAWQAGLHEFHADLMSAWEAVIGFAVDHLAA